MMSYQMCVLFNSTDISERGPGAQWILPFIRWQWTEACRAGDGSEARGRIYSVQSHPAHRLLCRVPLGTVPRQRLQAPGMNWGQFPSYAVITLNTSPKLSVRCLIFFLYLHDRHGFLFAPSSHWRTCFSPARERNKKTTSRTNLWFSCSRWHTAAPRKFSYKCEFQGNLNFPW